MVPSCAPRSRSERVERAGDHLADGLRLDEEPVVARDRLDHLDGARAGDELDQLVLEPQRIETIRGDPGDGDLRADARERGGDTTASAADVVVVHRLAQHDVGVGVEAARELPTVVLEVRLDRVPTAGERVLVPLVTTPEPQIELGLRAVADLSDAARDRQPDVRTVADRRVVVVALAELRVGADGAYLQRAQRDLLGARGRTA